MKKQIRLSLLVLLIIACTVSLIACGADGRAFEPESQFDISKSDSMSSVDAGTDSVKDQKLIKNCTAVAETKDFDIACEKLISLSSELGGYIESQTIDNSSVRYGKNSSVGRRMNATFRIPASKLGEFTGGIQAAVSIITFESDVKNVTEQYYDIEAKLKTLKTERESLLAMMESLNTQKDYDFWYTLHTRITELEKEIASYEGAIRNLDGKIDYSTVNLQLSEVVEYTKTQKVTFWSRIGSAFTQSWKNFGNGCMNFAVFIVRVFPTILTIAVIITVLVLIIRRANKKHRNRNGQSQ